MQETDARETLERTLNETRSAALDAERWFREEADALRAHGLEREEYFEARLVSERLEYENRLAELQTESERLGQARAAADKNVQRLTADLSEATRVLEDARREFHNTIDRLSTEHGTALAALIAKRDERLKEQAVRHDVLCGLRKLRAPSCRNASTRCWQQVVMKSSRFKTSSWPLSRR